MLWCAAGRLNTTATWNRTFQQYNLSVLLYPGFALSVPPVDAGGDLKRLVCLLDSCLHVRSGVVILNGPHHPESLHASAEPYNMLSNGTVVSAGSQTFFQDDAQSTATGIPRRTVLIGDLSACTAHVTAAADLAALGCHTSKPQSPTHEILYIPAG